MPDRIRQFADSTALSNMSPNGAVELAYISDVEGLGVKNANGNWKIAPSFFGSGLHFLETYKPDLWLSADSAYCGVTGARDFVAASSQYFSISSPPTLGTDDVTWCGWIKQDSGGSGTSNYVFDVYNSDLGMAVTVDQDNNHLLLFIGEGDGTIIRSLSNGTLAADTWHFCLITMDRDGDASIYLNDMGTPADSVDVTSTDGVDWGTGDSQWTFGAKVGGAQPLDGKLCRMGLCIGALLTQSDREELYNYGQGATWDELSASLQAKFSHYWNGLEASSTLYDQCGSPAKNGTDNNSVGHAAGPRVEQAADTSGNGYHGTLTGFPSGIDHWSSDVPAALGSGYSLLFDGSDDDVQTASGNHDFANTDLDVITIACWVKWGGSTSHPYAGICCIGEVELYAMLDTSYGILRVFVATDGASNAVSEAGTTISADAWTHVAIRYNDSGDRKVDVFLNGSESATYDSETTADGTLVSLAGTTFVVGDAHSSHYRFDGHIANLHVYHEWLSDADLALLAAGDSITPTPVMQYDFNDGPQQGAPANGDPIASLESREGQRYLFNQDTAANRPTFVTSGVNGQPVLNFDGTDDYLEIAQAILSGERGTVFAVWENTSTYGTCLSIGSSITEYCDIGQHDASNARMVHTSGGTTNSIKVPAANSTPHIVMFSSDGETYHFRVDGADETETVSGSNDGKLYGDDITGTPDQTELGSRVGASYEFDGYIAEIIAYDGVVLPTDVRDAIESYLATKYGITI